MATHAAMVVACAVGLWWAGFAAAVELNGARAAGIAKMRSLGGAVPSADELAAQRMTANLADPDVDQLARRGGRRHPD